MPLRFRETEELMKYWLSIRDGRHAPARASLKPSAVAGMLPRLFLLEARRGEWCFRLAGTELYTMYGGELTGSSFSGMWRGRFEDIRETVADAATRARPLLVRSTARSGEGSLDIETLLLPIRRDTDFADADMFLCVQTWDRSMTPRWLGGHPFLSMSGISAETLDDETGNARPRGGVEVFGRALKEIPAALAAGLAVVGGSFVPAA